MPYNTLEGDKVLENVIAFITIIVTFFLGKLSKKYEFVKNEIITIQNILVGITVAVIYYLVTKDVSLAIGTAGLFAGGTYDVVHNLRKMLCKEKEG